MTARIVAILLDTAGLIVLVFPTMFILAFSPGHLVEALVGVAPYLLVAIILFVAAWRVRRVSPADSIHRTPRR